MHHSGDGEPAVTFVAGGGAMGLDYLLSQQQVAELTSCLIYDRAGTGWSDDADLPRSAQEVTDELHDLLQLVGMQPPHILVGHSLGGAYVHRYAQRFPTEVAGLLLVEPAHPDWDNYMPEHLTLAANQTADMAVPDFSDDLVTLARGQFESGMFDAFPKDIREVLVDRHLSRERLLVGIKEGLNVLSVMDELRAGGPLPDVPLIVLSGTAIGPEQTVFQTEDNLRQQIAGSQRLFDAIATSVSDGQHRSLSDAAPVSLPITRPDASAEAGKDHLHRTRPTGNMSREPLNPSSGLCSGDSGAAARVKTRAVEPVRFIPESGAMLTQHESPPPQLRQHAVPHGAPGLPRARTGDRRWACPRRRRLRTRRYCRSREPHWLVPARDPPSLRPSRNRHPSDRSSGIPGR